MKTRILAALAAIWLWAQAIVAHVRKVADVPHHASPPVLHLFPNPSATAPIDPTPEVPAKAQEQDTMGIFAELSQDVLDFLKGAGKAVETFVISEGQKLVAAAKETFVGTAVMNIVSALDSETMDGSEKMETVITAAVPLLEKLVAGGGLPGLVTSVEDFAIELCQSVYNDWKAAEPKIIAQATAYTPAPAAQPDTESAEATA